LNCVAAKDQFDKQKDRIQAQNKQLDTRVKEALLGWSRCFRGKNAPQTQEEVNPDTP